jgi:hypothetical protein
MNKSFLVLALGLFFAIGQSFGQAFQKGDKIVNLGIGIGGLGVNATGEYGIADNIGIGAFLAYERRTFSYLYSSLGGNYGRNEITVGARAAYHAGELLNDKLDPYVAAGLGAYIYNDPYWDYDVRTNSWTGKSFVLPTFLFRIGARYAFSEKLGAFGDIGTGGSWIQGGVTFKF